MERDIWLKEYMARIEANYNDSKEFGRRWADRIESASNLLAKKIPQAAGTIKSGDFESHLAKITGTTGKISEMLGVVVMGEGLKREIYSVHYSEEDYSFAHIKKGFTVRYCISPGEYKSVLNLAGKPHIWQEMGEKTGKALEVIGVFLDSQLPRLTEDSHSADFNKIMAQLEEQVGNLPY